MERFSLREVNEFGAPSLITRTTNDVQQVQMLVLMGLTMMIAAPLTAIGGVIMALRTDVQLSALLLVVIPVMALVVGLLMWKAVPLFRVMQVKIDKINGVLRENLTGIRVIRAFVRTEHEEQRFADANEDLTDTVAAGDAAVRADHAGADADHEPVVDRDHLVRRPLRRRRLHADRRPHGVPELHHADPVQRDDGRHDHGHGAAGGGVGRADPGGAADRSRR